MKLPLLLFLLLCGEVFANAPDPHDPKYEWMDRLVEKNFAPFKQGVTQRRIDKTQKGHAWLVRVKVVDNKVYAVHGEKGAAYGMLEYLANTYGLPDLDILYYQQDGMYSYIPGRAPVFCPSKRKSINQGIYFVDWYTVLPNPQWDEVVERINGFLDGKAWNEKKDKLVWRGTTTDGFYSPEDWMEKRRGKLCYLSLLYPDIIDAKFSGVCRYTCRNPEELWNALPKGEYLTYEEQVNYRYQIVLDGMLSTYPGDRWRLLSNSVVFMHESEFGHWFYEGLMPWVHYVPVKSDLSDLMENYQKVRENEELATQLAANARAFALNYLMKEQIAVYCYKALIKYASLQSFKPQAPKESP